MNLTRQQILLGCLVLMGIVRVGDYVLSSLIQGPLQELQGETRELNEAIEKREKLLAETRQMGKKIESWEKRSLPADPETTRSLYRNWLLDLVRDAKLRNATVDSGSAANRRGLYRSMPFNVRARGKLSQITTALYNFEKSGQLHRITSLRIVPIGSSGQFEMAASVETVLLPGNSRRILSRRPSTVLVSDSRRDYDVIADENIFGIGVDPRDPMHHTILSAVTYRNGKPTAWITELMDDEVYKLAAGEDFDTTALAGRIVSVAEESAVIESGGEKFEIEIGESFGDALGLDPPRDAGVPLDNPPGV